MPMPAAESRSYATQRSIGDERDVRQFPARILGAPARTIPSALALVMPAAGAQPFGWLASQAMPGGQQ
jgi:hypothetical protein